MNINQIEDRTNGDILNNLKEEIAYGGYLVSLCSPCLIITTCLILNINIDIPLLFISYLLPLIVYSYDYYKDIDKDAKNNSERAIYLKKKAKNYPYLLGFYFILLISLLALYSNFNLILFISLIVLGGILYNFLLKGITKKIPAFKNMYTAMIWASGGAFFPLFYYSLPFNVSFIIIFTLIFLKCIINIIFFDLKDIENDKAEGLKTIPVIMGKKSTIKLLKSINIIAFIPVVLGVYFNLIGFSAVYLLVFIFYSYYYLNKANSASDSELESTAHLFADSEFLFWPIVLFIFNFII